MLPELPNCLIYDAETDTKLSYIFYKHQILLVYYFYSSANATSYFALITLLLALLACCWCLIRS